MQIIQEGSHFVLYGAVGNRLGAFPSLKDALFERQKYLQFYMQLKPDEIAKLRKFSGTDLMRPYAKKLWNTFLKKFTPKPVA